MDALLLYPKSGYDYGVGIAPPHSILSVGSFLKAKGHDVRLVDQRVHGDWKGVIRQALREKPRIVGISTMTGVQLKHAIEIARLVRAEAPGTPLVWGGVHVSLLPEQSAKSELVDAVVVGEGEEAIHEILEAVKAARPWDAVPGLCFRGKDGKVVKTATRSYVDMDELPLTDWSLLDPKPYIFHSTSLAEGRTREMDIGETSRGCPFKCAYCYNLSFNRRRWRALSAERAIEKIRAHVKAFDLDAIWIRDDVFFIDMKRAHRILEAVAELKVKVYVPGVTVGEFNRMTPETLDLLKRSGVEIVRFGIESGSDKTLAFIDKEIDSTDILKANARCRDNQVIPAYNAMIGFPTESREDVFETLDFLDRLKRENPRAMIAEINIFTPYPGTPLYEKSVQMGLPLPTRLEDWGDHHHLNCRKADAKEGDETFLKNITDISYAISDHLLATVPTPLRILASPAIGWCRFRWRRRWFEFAPELEAMRFLRRLAFRI